MNELALFTGTGGGLLGSRLLGWTPVCAVEKESYCREVLLRRQRDGLLDLFPIWDDICTFAGRPWRGAVDIVTAGFPCQPWSAAGKQLGKLDGRNLWPETIRVIGEVQPEWCLLENVPALLGSGYFGRILTDLAEVGFNARWGVLSAAGVGAPHIRQRIWVVADSDIERPQGHSEELGRSCQVQAQKTPCLLGSRPGPDPWSVEPSLGRVANGVPNRVDRLKAIGNGQVPAVVAAAWHILSRNGFLHRWDRGPWLVVVPLEDLPELARMIRETDVDTSPRKADTD